ncbi:transmembrane protein, putative [Entamoeba invadens IP1]|uniref:Transmembrane protein, putative n=1 Tax=Entamoeba invadens IP1 TaxID=370355 RepID=L7FLF0_ENTIV|nr:transmembrane protein, putative [Entamoeba invadens IP1]ELP83994.1 transmembrane protein, putative [Entamoeba invadens IP1]|eukprot:XP_004183340.1 transmembrane protein, putative [Entamoeba invadens IP1]
MPNEGNTSVLLTSLSIKGFSSVFVGFMLAVSFAMMMTMSLPDQYKTAALEDTCSFKNSTVCLSKLISTGQNFTLKLTNISSVNQKVHLYLVYKAEESKARIKMLINTALYKETTKTPTPTYNDVTLIKTTSKKHRVFCDKNSNCEMLLATVESSKKYNTVYAVMNVSQIAQSAGLTAPAIELLYVQPQYTSFEVFWRITLLIVMCVATLFFLYVLRGIPFKTWSLEQKATFLLMVTLSITNNAFYSYEFISANEFFPAINAMCDSLMLAALLLYILIIFDALRKPLSQRTFKFFYFPRFVLIILLESFVVNLYLYNADIDDPIMVVMKDPINATLAILTGLLTVVYMFWLVFAVIRSFSEARKLGEIGQRIRLYGTFTLVAIFILVVLLISNYFVGYKSNQAVYLTTIAYINIYALTLMVFYLPSNKQDDRWNQRRREIVLDDVKVTEYDEDDNELVVEQELTDNKKEEEVIGGMIDKASKEQKDDKKEERIEL